MTVITKRYDLRRELDGTSTVFDVFTGRPATVDHQLAVGLSAELADDTLQVLNLEDAIRRGFMWKPRVRR
ncbi:hypothetical protein BC360_29470 [Ensifer sp. LC163]|nr:hypothetical protein BC360_29470 [Ensifer sp. LC163]